MVHFVNIVVIKLWKNFHPHYVSRLLFYVESCLTQQLPTCNIEIGRKLWTCDKESVVSFWDFVGKTKNFSAWIVARFGREEGYI